MLDAWLKPPRSAVLLLGDSGLLMPILIPLVPATVCGETVRQHKSNGFVAHVDDLRLVGLIGLVKPFHGAYLLKKCSEQEARSFGRVPTSVSLKAKKLGSWRR